MVKIIDLFAVQNFRDEVQGLVIYGKKGNPFEEGHE